MTTPHLASRPTAQPRTTPLPADEPPRTTPPPADEPHRRAWLAPVTASVLLLLLGPAALALGGLSFMATDSCGPDHCSPALMDSLAVIGWLLYFGGPFSTVFLVASWALPWKRRWAGTRAWAACGALLPPVTVLFLVLTLPAP
ncbi:hypothetical protein ACWERY_33665 [Streptomyces sp. NPDC004082]|uniref:hypothetical protein n=1 Tax=Streptomyces sp. NPDC005496 TaxID=3364716 RepID=UPI0036C32699